MSRSRDTIRVVVEHLARAVEPLRRAVRDVDSFRTFMLRLGWSVESLPPGYQSLGGLVDEVVTTLQSLDDDGAPGNVVDLLTRVRGVYEAIGGIREAPDGVEAAAFLAEIGERLFELLLLEYLAAEFNGVYNACRMLGIIEHVYQGRTASRPGVVQKRIRWDAIPALVSDPLSIPGRVYGWGSREFRFKLLAEHLLELLVALGVPASVQHVDAALAAGLRESASRLGQSGGNLEVRIPIFRTVIADALVELAVGVLELPGEESKWPGIIILPVVPSSIGSGYAIDEDVTLRVRAGTDLASLFGVLLRPGELSVHFPFQPGLQLPSAGFGVELVYAPKEPTVLLGAPSASRLQLVGATTGVQLNMASGELELRVYVGLDNLALILAVGEQDGFISTLFGGADVTIPIPLVVEWSSKTGLHFSGGTGFEVAFYPHLELGPISIQEVRLGVRSTLESGRPPDLVVEVGATAVGTLGPVVALVDNIGVRLSMVFGAGNAGPFDIAVGYKPPSGLALSIDSGIIAGAGFLDHDPATGRYAGIVMLGIYGTLLTAIGLIDTKIPGAPNSYSFLLIIDAEFPPIQLGLGFTLNGVGGLAGVNRTLVVDALRSGIRHHSIDSILFPEDALAEAPRIVHDLGAIFPPTQGRYVFGPMVLIGWGTPTLAEAELGVVLELPDPVRLTILGELSMYLPRKDAAVVEFHLDALGAIDFSQKTLAIDATLYDSFVALYDVSGDMALRLSWADPPQFALAIGGFHPQFPVPANFPSLRRITIALGESENPRIRLQAYLAATSNTVQFGALAELFVEASGFNIYGWLGFDALFILTPFSFTADLSAGLKLRRDGTVLAGIWLDATLSGPRPWHVVGQATASVVINVTVPIDVTFGPSGAIEVPPTDPRPLLQAAIRDLRNWSTMMPPAAHQVVSLAASPPGQPQLLVDPAGALTMRQTVVPLGRRLTRFGAAKPVGSDQYVVDGVTINGQPATDVERVQDYFAPAQFEDLSNADKLSRPSFERMDSGIAVGGSLIAQGRGLAAVPSYDTIVIDAGGRREGTTYRPPAAVQATADRRSAAAASPLKGSRLTRFAPLPGRQRLVALDAERFVIASTIDLSPRTDLTAAGSRGVIEQVLAARLLRHPEERGALQVVRTSEAGMAA